MSEHRHLGMRLNTYPCQGCGFPIDRFGFQHNYCVECEDEAAANPPEPQPMTCSPTADRRQELDSRALYWDRP